MWIFILKILIIFKIANFIFFIIDSHQSKKRVFDDLSSLSKEEFDDILTEEYQWNYSMVRKYTKLFNKSKSICDYFFDVKVSSKFSYKDKQKINALLYLLSTHLRDNFYNLKNISKSVIKTYYYNHKYMHNERVVKICDPRQSYNILSILDAIKEKSNSKKVPKDFIDEKFLQENIVYNKAKNFKELI